MIQLRVCKVLNVLAYGPLTPYLLALLQVCQELIEASLSHPWSRVFEEVQPLKGKSVSFS